MTDDEYRWEPVTRVAGACDLRAEATTVHAAGAGDTVIDWEWPVPEPPPVTTIAWRIGHVAVGWAHRAALHFGGPPVDYDTVDWPLDATGALGLLDESHARWAEGVAALGDAGTAMRACGDVEGPFAAHPMAALVLHVNREAIHHLAEVALLRDLWSARHIDAAVA